jgi:exopolyphosphatase/guanosine-5'-triphosphate,3'-diphosphate pyrophosphatase
MKETTATGPMAVIDIGSHSMRMEIAQFNAQGEKQILENPAHPLFLGSDVFTKGKVSAENIRHAVGILQDYSHLMKAYGVTKYRAVATTAVREAGNIDLFLNRIKFATGIEVAPLEPTEEIKLIFLAVKEAITKRFGMLNHNAVICSIGTGSTQFAFVEAGHLQSLQTLRFGTLRLVEEMFSDTNFRKLKDTLDPFIEDVVNNIARMAPTKRSDLFIVVGATPRSLVSIGRRQTRPVQIASMSRKNFSRIMDKIVGVPAAELSRKYQIADSVAMGLEPCCNLVDHLFQNSNAEKLIIPFINTRDIILKDFLRVAAGEPDHFVEEIAFAARHIGEQYKYDARHAESVREISLQLFEKLQNLHNLPGQTRFLLEVAALLHDVGRFINDRQHHKHSYYIVKNSSLPGVTAAQQNLIAVLCRYHRRACPSASHTEYMSLPTDERVQVSKLAAILRLADALERAHHDRIKIRRTSLDEETLRLYIDPVQDLTLERLTIKRKSDLFTDTFGVNIEVIEQA